MELAIVLVIIGLIVGGVLVGQDLIKAAQIRSVVTDIERYNAAANTFQGKYAGLPGDLKNTQAVKFGFNTAANDAARNGTVGHGDGNGVLQPCDLAFPEQLGCENLLFWVDLSAARMIPFSATLTSVTGVAQPDMGAAQLANGILPKTKLRDTSLVAAFSMDGRNFFGVGEWTIADGDGEVVVAGLEARGLTPLEARGIDSKLDDGNPLTGTIISIERVYTRPDVVGSHTGCMSFNNDGEYFTTTDFAADRDSCSLSIRAAF